jgi:antitoxin MazE
VRVRIEKWSNSAAVRIPAAIMHAARLDLGEEVDLREEAGRIVIEPVQQNKDGLGELLKRINSKNQHEAVAFGAAVGREAST